MILLFVVVSHDVLPDLQSIGIKIVLWDREAAWHHFNVLWTGEFLARVVQVTVVDFSVTVQKIKQAIIECCLKIWETACRALFLQCLQAFFHNRCFHVKLWTKEFVWVRRSRLPLNHATATTKAVRPSSGLFYPEVWIKNSYCSRLLS